MSAGALNVLVEALKTPDMKEHIQRYAAVALSDLTRPSDDASRTTIIDLGVLDAIKRILSSTTIRNNELKYWTLMILYQLGLCGMPLDRK